MTEQLAAQVQQTPTLEWVQSEAKKAKELLIENKFVEAEKLMCEVNKQALILFNNEDLALGMAEFYYLYGTILVTKIGQNLDVFGERVREVEDQALGQEDEIETDEDRGEADVDGQLIREENDMEHGYGEERKTQVQAMTAENNQAPNQTHQQQQQGRVEDLDDFKIAWENLESARVILEKHYTSETQNKQTEPQFTDYTHTRNLAKVLIRLAELEQWRDNFDAALENLQKSLELRLLIENKENSRDLAECYFLVGNVHLYNYKEGCEQNALEQYKQALQILENNLADELKLERKDVHILILNYQKNIKLSGILTQTDAPSMLHLKESFMDTTQTKELKQVITMLYEKIEDVKIALKEINSEEYKKLKLEMEQMKQQQENDQTFSTQPQQQTSQPVVNLGHFGNAIKRPLQDGEKEIQAGEKEKENSDGNNNMKGEEPTKKVKFD